MSDPDWGEQVSAWGKRMDAFFELSVAGWRAEPQPLVPVLAWAELPTERIDVPAAELSLPATLACGQAFRWLGDDDGWWRGVVEGRAMRLRRVDEAIDCQVYSSAASSESASDLVRRYFRLDVCLSELTLELAEADSGIRAALAAYPGLRLLAQEPEETLLSYLCSTANSVPRISSSIGVLASELGRPIAVVEDTAYHTFPTAQTLADASADCFRAAGLGWRGGSIQTLAQLLIGKPPGWVAGLASGTYAEAKAALVALPGVGPKIADCVCLFALGKDDAVPVDTHVWALAGELFPAELGDLVQRRSISAGAYERVALAYRLRYGRRAGWAQEYLYHWRRQGYR